MATYNIDALHSEITFKIKHLMISSVTGNFEKFTASLSANNDDFTDAAISFSAEVASINTGNSQRDEHLKSEDFFDVAKYPAITFNSSSLTKNEDGDYVLVGDLTIKETTKQISLLVNYGGTMTDFYGQFKAGFEIEGKINRKDFGLTWNAVTEAGGIVVSDEIRLLLSVQMIKQAP